ncbi:MAG: hypothetical protein LBP59_10290 [Planctomycetaceae bacterium]|nr:hypothetical protein [Planctomycetaceae bacterium]
MTEIITNIGFAKVLELGGMFTLAFIICIVFYKLGLKQIAASDRRTVQLMDYISKSADDHKSVVNRIAQSFEKALDKWDRDVVEIKDAIKETSQNTIKTHEKNYHDDN